MKKKSFKARAMILLLLLYTKKYTHLCKERRKSFNRKDLLSMK